MSFSFYDNQEDNLKDINSPAQSQTDSRQNVSTNHRETESIFDQKEFVKSMNPSSNWNFEGYSGTSSSNNNDGVYFYGASGAAVFEESAQTVEKYTDSIWNIKGREGHGKSSSVTEDYSYDYQNDTGYYSNSIVCPFFKAGDCKFGSRCRNYHEHENYEDYAGADGDSDGRNCIYETPKEVVDNYIECSICISTPDKEKGDLYGIMSHCNCVFCLGCIRGWRVEGFKVASKSDQVRMCPTCRVKSFYVVPSINFVSGQEKEDLIARYKQSLAAKPCKVSIFPLSLYELSSHHVQEADFILFIPNINFKAFSGKRFLPIWIILLLSTHSA